MRGIFKKGFEEAREILKGKSENKIKKVEKGEQSISKGIAKSRQESALGRLKSTFSRPKQNRVDLKLTGKLAGMVYNDAQSIGIRPASLLRSIIVYNYWKKGGEIK